MKEDSQKIKNWKEHLVKQDEIDRYLTANATFTFKNENIFFRYTRTCNSL